MITKTDRTHTPLSTNDRQFQVTGVRFPFQIRWPPPLQCRTWVLAAFQLRRSSKNEPAAQMPRLSIKTSCKVPNRSGMKDWCHSSDAANAIQGNIDPTIDQSVIALRHHFTADTVKSVSMKNSVTCQPLTIANHDRPQNRANRCIESRSAPVSPAMSSKNLFGRITVHDVPKISATQILSSRGRRQPRRLGDEEGLVSTASTRSMWLLLQPITFAITHVAAKNYDSNSRPTGDLCGSLGSAAFGVLIALSGCCQ